MILVLLGTQDNDFHRLIASVEENIVNGNIQDEVIVQSGYTKYNSDKMRIFSMIPKDEIEALIEKAEFVITHAGVGSIETSLEKGKKVIVVPRLKKFGEHINDHQLDIEREFSRKGFVLGVEDPKNLGMALNKVHKFIPALYEQDNSNMIKIITDFIG